MQTTQWHNFFVALKELQHFQSSETLSSKVPQKMLRNLGLIDLLLQLLQRNLPAVHTSIQLQTAVCNILAAYLVGNSPKNRRYLLPYFPFLLSRIEREVRASNNMNTSDMIVKTSTHSCSCGWVKVKFLI